MFTPHDSDKQLGARSVRVDLADVVEVGVEPRGVNPFSGAWRRRLRVVLVGGHRHLFVVKRVTDVVARIQDTITEQHGRSGHG